MTASRVTGADLPRTLTFVDGAALLVGSVIGSGIFVVPSLIAQRVPEPGLVIGIWIVSGLLVLCGALTLAELGAMLPQSGGLYVYMREAYGPFWAFLYGWTITLVAIPGSIAALTSAFLLYLKLFLPMTLWVEKAVGIGILLGLAHVNTRGARQGAGVQNLFTALKVGGPGRARRARARHAPGKRGEFPSARPRPRFRRSPDRRRPCDDLDPLRV